jgi:hypothetical protein
VRYEVGDFPSPFGGAVEAKLVDGSTVHAELPHPAGTPENPLEPEAVTLKFRDNATLSLVADDVAALERAIGTLDQQEDLAILGGILTRAVGPAAAVV